MDTQGKHLLAEYKNCDPYILNSIDQIDALLCQAARDSGATVLFKKFHSFSGHGVSGVVVVEESHLSIHTWPEKSYAAVDVYTCGVCEPLLAHETLREGLKAEDVDLLLAHRGQLNDSCSIRIDSAEKGLPMRSPKISPRQVPVDYS
ncbi:MAG: adenosylmethionine decarboxylase [Pseudobacteriovorax sp.]|nr:adenosylmethionine decarboxylase [Pseudobacteriovorax sp.]